MWAGVAMMTAAVPSQSAGATNCVTARARNVVLVHLDQVIAGLGRADHRFPLALRPGWLRHRRSSSVSSTTQDGGRLSRGRPGARAVPEQVGGLARHRQPAGLQHIAAVGGLERQGRVLLDQQDRHARSACRSRMIAKISRTISGARPRLGSSSSSRRGPAHQRAGDREHLLLAAAQRARRAGGGARPGAGSARTGARCRPGSRRGRARV